MGPTARFACLALLLSACLGLGSDEPAEPPGQPASGPGGAQYSHGSFATHTSGRGETAFRLYIPEEPRATKCPVLALIHGSLELEPTRYGAWISHLARRGNVVIFPAYQSGPRTPPAEFTANAARSVALALARLRTAEAVQPEEGHFALAGHGEGAIIAANLAAGWRELGIPRPAAVLCVQPEGAQVSDPRRGVPQWDLGSIPVETLLLCLVGQSAGSEGTRLARAILDDATAVPWAGKNLVTARDDDHGSPALVADRRFPTGQLGSGLQVNALDYFACWKLLDGLTDAAFFGRNRQFALGNSPEQRYMGAWSDGTPARELDILSGPADSQLP